MTRDEIIKLGRTLGLNFNEDDNFPDKLKKNIVVFNGCNGQRFLIDGEWDDNQILRMIGGALMQYGMRLKAMDINRVMSINSETTQLPINLS